METIRSLAALYLGRILLAGVIWFVGRRLIQFLIEFTDRRAETVQVDKSLHSFLTPLLKIVLQVLLVLTVAATLGLEITTFAAIIGAAGFAVGLAFQGSLANFAGGVLILVLRPFKVGDFIEAGGFSGTVREIQVFYTVFQTLENQKVIIPNSDLSNSSAINYSAYDRRQTNIKLAVAYDADLGLAKSLIREVAAKHPLILKEPAPFVVMGEYGPDGVVLYIRVWALSRDYWTMYFEFLEQIKEAIQGAGIEIPLRQLDVTIKKS